METLDYIKEEIDNGKKYSYLKLMFDNGELSHVDNVGPILTELITFYEDPYIERYEICGNLLIMKKSLNAN